MSIFQRLFKIGQTEAHNVINKLEDPIRMTEQGIRDLKSDLQGAMTGLAEVKGIAIRLMKEAEEARRQASEYERKAMLMLQRAQAGQMDMAQAERLATEALTMKDSSSGRAIRLFKDAEQQQRLGSQLQEKITQFKSIISTHENELITLRARAKTAAAWSCPSSAWWGCCADKKRGTPCLSTMPWWESTTLTPTQKPPSKNSRSRGFDMQ